MCASAGPPEHLPPPLGTGQLSCVPSHRSPQTHQAPVCCEFSHFPNVVEHGAEGKVGSEQHRASRLPDPILHPLFLTLHIPLAGSMHLPWCPAGMFQPHSGPRDFRPDSGFLKHFLSKERESASYSSLLRKSFIFLIIPLLFQRLYYIGSDWSPQRLFGNSKMKFRRALITSSKRSIPLTTQEFQIPAK